MQDRDMLAIKIGNRKWYIIWLVCGHFRWPANFWMQFPADFRPTYSCLWRVICVCDRCVSCLFCVPRLASDLRVFALFRPTHKSWDPDILPGLISRTRHHLVSAISIFTARRYARVVALICRGRLSVRSSFTSQYCVWTYGITLGMPYDSPR